MDKHVDESILEFIDITIRHNKLLANYLTLSENELDRDRGMELRKFTTKKLERWQETYAADLAKYNLDILGDDTENEFVGCKDTEYNEDEFKGYEVYYVDVNTSTDDYEDTEEDDKWAKSFIKYIKSLVSKRKSNNDIDISTEELQELWKSDSTKDTEEPQGSKDTKKPLMRAQNLAEEILEFEKTLNEMEQSFIELEKQIAISEVVEPHLPKEEVNDFRASLFSIDITKKSIKNLLKIFGFSKKDRKKFLKSLEEQGVFN